MATLVKSRALALGFDSVGITDLTPVPHGEALQQWLRLGMAGTMTYMHRQAARRLQPATILEGATRAIVVTRSYYRKDPATTPGRGTIAMYARGTDYHEALAGPLHELEAFAVQVGPPGTVARSYVDAGPVPERELAQRAGLGWMGKNTMLIDPSRGSYFFIASVLTSLDLPIDQPFEADRCGTCRKCLDACPTSAFPEARVLDSRRCISYLTIEYKGTAPENLASRMGDKIFGCDICQDVCPWNVRFAESMEPGDSVNPWLVAPDLVELAGMTDEQFALRYAGTAMERPGPEGMRRNARVALGNLSDEVPCPTP
jgi:epoxyqueuosine reductase